jgi:hypothetical protein
MEIITMINANRGYSRPVIDKLAMIVKIATKRWALLGWINVTVQASSRQVGHT